MISVAALRRNLGTAGALLAMIATACDRPASPRAASQPASAPAKTHAAAQPASKPAVVPVGADRVATPQVDPTERDVTCPRIVCTAPNVTEICAALGLAPCIVGRTRFCTYPPAVVGAADVGGLNDFDAERLLTVRPELVVVAGASRAQTEKLERLNIHYVSTPDTTLGDLFTTIREVGGLVKRPRTAAQLCAAIRTDLDSIVERHRAGPRRRVLVLTSPLVDPPTQAFIAGPGSFYADLLRLAGHENVGDPSDRPFASASLEFVLRANPDVIIELAPDSSARPGGDADALRVWAKVGPLRAVETRRVHVLVGPEHFLLGPRITQTFEQLCARIDETPHD